MWSPEELGEDAGPEHPTRRDDVPGRAHQKIREVRPRRQAAHHAVGERGPPHADPDESLEQPLPAEFAPARAVVGRERRGVEAVQGGDQALGQELGAPQRSVNPLARERIEEVGGVTHEHGAASGRDGGARPLRERTGGQNVANQSPWVEPPREPGKSVELGEKIATEVPAFAPAPPHRRERHHERHRGDDERTSPRRRATTERRPSAPTTTRLRYVSRFPFPDRAKTPAAVLPSKTTLSTVRPSRTMAPSRAVAATRIVSNVVRGRAKLYGRGPPRNRPHMATPQGATTFIPYSLACAAPSTASRMPPPSRSRISVVAGLKYSEHALSRGKRARSMSRTEAPARASSKAVVAPAGPAPTTTTSQRSVTPPL